MSAADGAAASEPPLALPSAADAAQKLHVGGDSVSLDKLGPMVVNADGSLSRVANWDSMPEDERERTMRIVAKRNAKRLEALKAEGKDVGGVIPQRR